jgi:large subunit ribosomal protein L23
MNKVVFEVPPTLSKPDLKAFLESVYALDVAAINTMNYAGKRQRAAGGKVYTRADWKKAVVTLKNPVQLEQSALDKLESARQRS